MAKSWGAHAHACERESSVFRPLLAPAVTSELLADASRDAALAFCRGVLGGWSKRELVAWLRGPYQGVAGLVDFIVAPPIDDAPPSTQPSPMLLPTDEDIASVVDGAFECAMDCVEALARGDGLPFFEEAIERGSLVEAITVRGEVLLVPLHRPRLRLARRLIALFLADYMLRPDDYRDIAHSFWQCDVCDVVLIGTGAREQGLCNLHARRSGIVFSNGERPDDSVDVDLSDLAATR
jgi:hypothetical protein